MQPSGITLAPAPDSTVPSARSRAGRFAIWAVSIVVLAALAYFAYNTALSRIDASKAAVYIYFEPVVTVLFGVTLLGEPLSWQIIVGAVVIAASVALVTLMKQPKKE